ncbi:EF-hand domain-containing protein [Phreatobacter cathodiphilus]|uniref:EF-hand domain-containing protein n=1 Tax=Phreatobacter cathodiphilus TaxID=1868589 RepID=A0A2S0NGP7_9HYPH|nr:EF-hand domain-containing protein [Phreatobacter cathodiphilus]AVO47216.1 hypothetical protein C6569_20420 [Phreatobacter cathodiphilus]
MRTGTDCCALVLSPSNLNKWVTSMKRKPLKVLTLAAILVAPLSGALAQTGPGADRQKMANNFAEADANRDGMLTFDEFVKFLQLNARDNLGRAAQVVQSGNYRMAFSRVDTDRNGVLSQQELQALAR